VSVAGVVLAAGAGRRFGTPKALVRLDGRLLVERAVDLLRDGGCEPVLVVLGAAAGQVRATADLRGAVPVTNPDWATGMGSSLRAGLAAVPADVGAVVIALVDTPGLGPDSVRRLIAAHRTAPRAVHGGASAPPSDPPVVGQPSAVGEDPAVGGDSAAGGDPAAGAEAAAGAFVATYGGRTGHPVLLDRAVLAEVAASAAGDRGAGPWLAAHPQRVRLIACDGTGDPRDVDVPEDLPAVAGEGAQR
jgi:CTP:molybdopterin cytidylyltransferase MocA